jgi:hypothetical protein
VRYIAKIGRETKKEIYYNVDCIELRCKDGKQIPDNRSRNMEKKRLLSNIQECSAASILCEF